MATRFRYTPLAKIASGGTATVFVGARSRGAPGALVALKRPHAHILEDARQRNEVLREARVAASLHHPNVVGVREVETLGEDIQLVMDYVEGAALGSLIALEARRDARIPAPVALRILLDACEGLAAVHAATDPRGALLGLVHRDVSPQNILVGVDGRARLTDFGLAKAVYAGAPSTTQGTLKGKLGYMAPEYVNRGQVDRSVDIFAMGVVIWEALAGRRLFRGENEVQTLDRLLREEAPSLASLDSALEPLAAFDDVIAKATKKEPSERLASTVELVDALGAAVRAAGMVASPEDVAAYVRGAVGAEIAERDRAVRGALRARSRPLWIGGGVVMVCVAAGGVLAGRSGSSTSPSATANSPAGAVPSSPADLIQIPPALPSSLFDSPRPTGSAGQYPTATATPTSAPNSVVRSRPPRPGATGALPPNPYNRPPH
jgi:serine/threonine-protein kinase